jgi:hypothetical protein
VQVVAVLLKHGANPLQQDANGRCAASACSTEGLSKDDYLKQQITDLFGGSTSLLSAAPPSALIPANIVTHLPAVIAAASTVVFDGTTTDKSHPFDTAEKCESQIENMVAGSRPKLVNE